MTKLATTVFCTLSLAAGVAMAASHSEMKKPDAAMAKDTMTMQQCKDHMGMAKKDGMKKDDAMMKKDATCADMMKKDAAMKKDAPAPAKK
ncbi:MAG TPA: hypothetical protein VHM00_06695 [Caldimonas sp.]|jgi:hypothetical protein|nr:hypothetical protein [Caldimonas sp.]HEX2540755.1 hypothetical protein [Caldimonas sp.]